MSSLRHRLLASDRQLANARLSVFIRQTIHKADSMSSLALQAKPMGTCPESRKLSKGIGHFSGRLKSTWGLDRNGISGSDFNGALEQSQPLLLLSASACSCLDCHLIRLAGI